MERIDYDGIALLVRNPENWAKETVTINLGGRSNGSSKRERAEIISVVAYPMVAEIIELNYEAKIRDLEEHGVARTLYGGIKLVSRGLKSETPFLSRPKSLDNVVTGAEFAGDVDLRYMLFGRRNNSWIRDLWGDKEAKRQYIGFLYLLNKKVLDKSISPRIYIEAIERIEWIHKDMVVDLSKASFVYKQRAINNHRKILHDDPLILPHLSALNQ
ncbi:hypothetical protein HYT53_03455 [Candidatus Woesearchaeota archaeon]|nr:hypothetical protein [Candidatus Woesearchaeota archaeon]